MKLSVVLVRHGESSNNIILGTSDYQSNRVADPALSEKGIQQITVSQSPLKELKVEEIWCGPQLRAVSSAKIIQDELKIPAKVFRVFNYSQLYSFLHEIGGCHIGGVGQPGNNREFFEANFPNFWVDPAIDDQGWWKQENKETLAEGTQRAKFILNFLLEHQKQLTAPKTIAIITHGNLANQILRIVNQVSVDSNVYFFHQNAGLTGLEFHPEVGAVMTYFNNYSHLGAGLAQQFPINLLKRQNEFI